MTNVNGYELLRIILLGGFAGFAIFSISYAMVVWSRRNRNTPTGKHVLATVGPILAIIGLVALLSGVVQAKLVTYTGLIDGNASGRSNLELRARLGALSNTPLKIDPALTQRQSQLRAQIDQLSHFQFELEKSHRELDREHTMLRGSYAREMSSINAEIQVAEASVAGYQEQIVIAERQLQRGTELSRLGSGSEANVDQRKIDLLALKNGSERAAATISAANKRAAIATEKFDQATQLYKVQFEEIEQHKKEYSESLNVQQSLLLAVEKLIAEDGEAALTAMSSGKGFIVKVVVATTELSALKQVPFITFEPRNIPIRSRFNGTFRESVLLEASPDKALVSFDVQLPSDVLSELKSSSEPLLVDAYWNPPIVRGTLVQASSGVIGIALLLWILGVSLGNKRPVPSKPKLYDVKAA